MYEQNLMLLSFSPKIKHFVGSVVCVCVCACAEIKAMPDLNLESDMKLDKLESFLGKLNNKSESFTDTSINGACLHVRMEADSCRNYLFLISLDDTSDIKLFSTKATFDMELLQNCSF